MTNNTVGNAVAEQKASAMAVTTNSRDWFASILPSHVDVRAFVSLANAHLRKSPKLAAAANQDPAGYMTALSECARLGLVPGDTFHILNFKSRDGWDFVGVVDYTGDIELIYRAGAVSSIKAEIVYERDQFEFTPDMDRPVHRVDWFGGDRGEMVGVYAYAELAGGAVSRVVLLGRDDVFAARDAGGYKPDDPYSPWNRADAGKEHPEFTGRSMWWKTGAKRLEPWVPTSAEYRREQLRASATAADLSGMRSRVPELPAGNGHSEPQDIVDAETVEDPTPAEPAGGTGSTGAPAPARTAPRAGKGATGDLDKLLRQLPLGEPADVKALMQWQCGRDYPTGQQVVKVAGFLRGHLDACQGDTAEAASAIWAQYRAIREQDAQGEPGAAEASDG